MIFDYWNSHLDEFLDLLRQQQYYDTVVREHKRMAKLLMDEADNNSWQSYDEVRNYINQIPNLKDKPRWRRLSTLGKLEAYHLRGKIPLHKIDKLHVTSPLHSKGMLDFFPLQDRIEEFLACYKVLNKSDAVINTTRCTVNRIIVLSRSISWDSYDEIRAWFAGKDLCDSSRRRILSVIDQLEYWSEHGSLSIAAPEEGADSKPSHTCRHMTPPWERITVEPSLGEHDFSYLQKHMDEFLSGLKQNGYSESALKVTLDRLKMIIVLSRTIRWNSIQEIREWNDQRQLNYSYKRSIAAALDKYEFWLKNGAVPEHPSVQKKLKERQPSIGNLNLTFWQDHLAELLDYMESHDYCKDSMQKVGYVTRRLIILSRKVKWDSYEDIWQWYNNQNYRSGYLHDIRAILGVLEQYHLSGIMPNNRLTQSPLCPRENAYSKLVPEYKKLIDYGCNVIAQMGHSPNSITRSKTNVSSFLYFLQSSGIESLDKVTEEVVTEFFYKDGRYLRGQSTASCIALFFRRCEPFSPECCKRISIYIPKFHSARHTIQYLNANESDLFRKALNNADNGLSYKERAIGSILFYTGMRSSDVAGLKMDSIDLKNKTIQFTQAKTDNPVKLPLSVKVGNAIYDYCVHERPQSDSSYLFVTDNAPHHHLSTGGIDWAVEKVMGAAGIRQNKGDRKGAHIFRHRAASTMAANNVPSPVISATLGHASPKSLDAYLYADMDHIRSCSLGLEKYPLAKEVISLG